MPIGQSLRYGFLLFLFSISVSASAQIAVVAIGSNHSVDENLKPLRYAVKDARRFANVMRTVGMLTKKEVSLFENPNLKEFRQALHQVKSQWLTESLSQSQKFVFYYSGHADARGLHLADGIFSKEELHQALEDVSAKTKVVLLDSCFAGGLAEKGVREVKPFKIPRFTYDEPTGSIFLSATSSDRLAYESEELGGSLFSHNLVIGLQGQADGNKDGVVTATELYEFSFRQSQLQNQLLPSISQKPEFISDLKGRGAVALSFPVSSAGTLHLLEGLSGSVHIRSLRGLHSFQFDLGKGSGGKVSLAAGEYQVRVRGVGRNGVTEAKVHPHKTTILTPYDFDWLGGKPPVLTSVLTKKGPSVESSTEIHEELQSSINVGVSTINSGDGVNYAFPSVSADILSKRNLEGERYSLSASLGNSEDVEYLSAGIQTDWQFFKRQSDQGHRFFELGLNLGFAKIGIRETRRYTDYYYNSYAEVMSNSEGVSAGAQIRYSFLSSKNIGYQISAIASKIFSDQDQPVIASVYTGGVYVF